MRYAFFVYDEYIYRKKNFTRNLTLYDLVGFLDEDEHNRWSNLDKDEKNPENVIIWSDWNIKEALTSEDFTTNEEFLDYINQYKEYRSKRFTDMPVIRISLKNYEELEKQWKNIREHTPKYLILREHCNGYIDILEKDELSAEDIVIMNREHKIFQNYIKRRGQYVKAHPEKRNKIWRSPVDNEFESDFALYDPADEQGID